MSSHSDEEEETYRTFSRAAAFLARTGPRYVKDLEKEIAKLDASRGPFCVALAKRGTSHFLYILEKTRDPVPSGFSSLFKHPDAQPLAQIPVIVTSEDTPDFSVAEFKMQSKKAQEKAALRVDPDLVQDIGKDELYTGPLEGITHPRNSPKPVMFEPLAVSPTIESNPFVQSAAKMIEERNQHILNHIHEGEPKSAKRPVGRPRKKEKEKEEEEEEGEEKKEKRGRGRPPGSKNKKQKKQTVPQEAEKAADDEDADKENKSPVVHEKETEMEVEVEVEAEVEEEPKSAGRGRGRPSVQADLVNELGKAGLNGLDLKDFLNQLKERGGLVHAQRGKARNSLLKLLKRRFAPEFVDIASGDVIRIGRAKKKTAEETQKEDAEEIDSVEL